MPDQVPWFEDTRWLVTTLLALWGAGLATYHQVSLYLAKRPRVRVLLLKAVIPASPVTQLGENRELVPALSIVIKNYGQLDMTFEQLCCELEVKGSTKGTVLVKPRLADPQLPATIKHGQNIKMVATLSGLADALKELSPSPRPQVRVSAKDAIGRRFRSKWMKITLAGEERPAV